jgi:hypothetical protein
MVWLMFAQEWLSSSVPGLFQKYTIIQIVETVLPPKSLRAEMQRTVKQRASQEFEYSFAGKRIETFFTFFFKH